MPANLHFFAHAKQLLSLLPHTHSKHTTCLPLHRIPLYLPNTRSHFASTQKTHLRHSPPTITASPHTTCRLMARSPHPLRTAAASIVAHVAAPPRSLYCPLDRCRCIQACHVHTTHNSHYSLINKPTTRHVHTTQTIYISPHTPTHLCLQIYTSLPMPNSSFASCHRRIQNTHHVPPTALYSIVPTKHSHPFRIHPTKSTCGPALPPSQPHPTQPAASWLAPSPTTYSSCVNNGTC